MGSGDVFRGVAQGLLGAGGAGIDYWLKRRQADREFEQSKALQQMKREMTPLEEQETLARIRYYNRGRVNEGGEELKAIDRRVDEIINQEEIARGTPFTPIEKARAKSKLLQQVVFKSSDTSFNQSGPDFFPTPSSEIKTQSPTQTGIKPWLKNLFAGETPAVPESNAIIQSQQDVLNLVNAKKITKEEGRARILQLRQLGQGR